MLMQNFKETKKSIMVFLKKVFSNAKVWTPIWYVREIGAASFSSSRNRLVLVCEQLEAKSGMISVAAQKLSSIVVYIVKKWLSLLRSCSVANFSVSIWFFQFFIAKI